MTTEQEGITEDLRESYKKYGPLRRVIVTQFGIAGGETRRKAVPEWPEVRKEVANYYEHLKLKAADNIQAVKPASWWEGVVNEAAGELAKQGVKPGEISKKLIEDFGLSKARIMVYLGPGFKEPAKVEAGQKGGRPPAEDQPGIAAKPAISTPEPETSKSSKEEPDIAAEPEPAKREPYSRPQPDPKRNLVGEFTRQQMDLIGGLQYLHLDYKGEFHVPVEKYACPKCGASYANLSTEELPAWDKAKGGRTCREDGTLLEQVQYKCDIYVPTNAGFAVTLEVEGEGSSSKDNVERETLLKQKNVRTAHIPNDMAERYPEEIAGLVRAFLP